MWDSTPTQVLSERYCEKCILWDIIIISFYCTFILYHHWISPHLLRTAVFSHFETINQAVVHFWQFLSSSSTTLHLFTWFIYLSKSTILPSSYWTEGESPKTQKYFYHFNLPILEPTIPLPLKLGWLITSIFSQCTYHRLSPIQHCLIIDSPEARSIGWTAPAYHIMCV